MAVMIHVKSMSKAFPNGNEHLQVLSHINFTVNAGETVSIQGESGSGKSTLLCLIAALDKPDSGSIIVNGKDVQTLTEKEVAVYRGTVIGLVFQFHYLLRDFNVIENVMLPALMRGSTRADAHSTAAALLAQVGMEDRMLHLPPQLSGGERQRASVARALINDPDIILADEPTGNLDTMNSGIVEDMLFSLVAEYNKTLILVTHNSSLAARAQRTMYLKNGCIQ